MTAQTANLTVAAGNSASTVLNVNYNGTLGAVTFACSGLPTASTCAFNPGQVTAAGATPVTLTIATTMRSTVVQHWPLGLPPLFTTMLALLGLTALALAFPGTKKRRLQLTTGFAGIVLLVAGCGGDGKPVPVPGLKGLGTPVGTSAVVVTASSASGGATATSTVNLTVQ
jgi:hypothetical protein